MNKEELQAVDFLRKEVRLYAAFCIVKKSGLCFTRKSVSSNTFIENLSGL